MKQEERSSRPRQMIHDAQEHAYQWHEKALQAHQGVAQADREAIRRMFHTAVLNYWTQLRRHSDNKHARDLWTEPVITGDGEIDALKDLGGIRFETERSGEGHFDPETGEVVGQTVRPASLSIEQSAEALDQLDRVANALSFDAAAKEERPRYGAVEAEDGEGVEVPEDAVA